FPYRTPNGANYDSGNYPGLLDQALALASYETMKAERDARRARGELVGIGLVTFIETTAAGWESGAVRVEPDGSVTAISGSSSHGQGHQTSFAQIVADQLGVPIERVRLRQNDTSLTQAGVGTFGSRSAAIGGSALVEAAGRVRQQ